MDVYRRHLRIRLTKISCAGPNYESIRTLSYSFISTLDPSGPEHQHIYSSLRETEQVSLSFHARIQRGSRGSGSLGESCTMLRTKNEELLSDSRAWTPPRQKLLDPCMVLHSVLITTVQYRICDIPVKGLWASSVRMRPLTCHLSHHFAYMKCHSSAYFIKVSAAAGWERERGLRTAKFNYDNLIISADPQDDPKNHMHWGK